MSATPQNIDTPEGREPSRWDARGWGRSAALGLFLAVVYLANGREIGQYDTEPTTLTALTLVRGEGIYLDRFRPVLRESDGRLPPYVERVEGRIISRYPLATAFLAAPLVLPQAWYYDIRYPGWDRRPDVAWGVAKRMGKNAAAILAALAGVAIYRLIRGLGMARVALPATLAAALGTDLWTVGSQALWQHGPAALMLTLTILLLLPDRPSRLRVLLAGLTTVLMVACRAIDVIFAGVVLAWLAWSHPRRLAWFLPMPVVVGGALIAYNLAYFGTLSGGQAALEAMHPEVHGVPGPWAGSLLDGMAGTLVSPARGLLVFSPWVALSVALAPWTLGKLRPWPLVRWLVVVGLAAYLLVLSKYAVWWAGHTFGPRYWTDAAPLLAVLLALALDWCRVHLRGMLVLFALTIAVSIALQVVGASCFPSSWNLAPTNIDRDHDRLWDWSDTEVRRSLIEALEARNDAERFP